VGKLRTHASKDVSDLAKELVKKWKNDVEKAKVQSGHSSKASHSKPGEWAAPPALLAR
jgi:transcription elongation factor S-II